MHILTQQVSTCKITCTYASLYIYPGTGKDGVYVPTDIITCRGVCAYEHCIGGLSSFRVTTEHHMERPGGAVFTPPV